MSDFIQLYSDKGKTTKAYPIETTAAIMHGEKALPEVLYPVDSLSVRNGALCITFEHHEE